ncbi:hypothetical protein OB920_10755 [Halobacteria archaeon HArc-gm2]|nr:hypothetical protein [Halobacteria archaeon HArc-gm2]
MSLRQSVAPSIRAVHPALFLVGFAVVALQTALSFALAAVEATLSPVYGPVLTLAGPVAVLLLTAPLAVGLYEPVRERTGDARETISSAIGAVRRYYLRVLTATLSAFAAAVALALAGTSLAFVLATVLRYGQYVTGDPGQPIAVLAVWGFPFLFAVFLAAGLLVTRFADVFVAYGGERPRAAWQSSAGFARRRPLSFLGYALVTAVLLGTVLVLQFAFGQVDDATSVAAAIGVVVIVGTVGVTLASALHVTYFERTVRPALQAVPPVTVRWTRVATVAVVLVAAIAGAGYVRAVDAGAGQADMQELPDDPEAASAVAAANTRHANHRRIVLARNASEPDSEFRRISESAVDYDDRRVSVFYYGENPDQRVGSYYSEGTIAMPSGGGSSRGTFGPVARERNGWTVVAMPGHALIDPAAAAPVPYAAEGWPVESSNESTIVYRIDDPSVIEAAAPNWHYGMHSGLAIGSYLRIVVDRDRGVVDRAYASLESRESFQTYEYEIRYSEVGTADVERPAEIGSRSPMEWFWDVLYY